MSGYYTAHSNPLVEPRLQCLKKPDTKRVFGLSGTQDKNQDSYNSLSLGPTDSKHVSKAFQGHSKSAERGRDGQWVVPRFEEFDTVLGPVRPVPLSFPGPATRAVPYRRQQRGATSEITLRDGRPSQRSSDAICPEAPAQTSPNKYCILASKILDENGFAPRSPSTKRKDATMRSLVPGPTFGNGSRAAPCSSVSSRLAALAALSIRKPGVFAVQRIVLDDNSCMKRAIIAPLLSNVNSLLHTSIKDEVTAQGLDLACGPTKTPSDVVHRTAALAQHSLPPICKHGSLKVPRYRPKCPSRRGSGGEDSLDAPQQRLQAPATYVAPAGYSICCAIAVGPGSGNLSLRLSSDHEFHSWSQSSTAPRLPRRQLYFARISVLELITVLILVANRGAFCRDQRTGPVSSETASDHHVNWKGVREGDDDGYDKDRTVLICRPVPGHRFAKWGGNGLADCVQPAVSGHYFRGVPKHSDVGQAPSFHAIPAASMATTGGHGALESWHVEVNENNWVRLHITAYGNPILGFPELEAPGFSDRKPPLRRLAMLPVPVASLEVFPICPLARFVHLSHFSGPSVRKASENGFKVLHGHLPDGLLNLPIWASINMQEPPFYCKVYGKSIRETSTTLAAAVLNLAWGHTPTVKMSTMMRPAMYLACSILKPECKPCAEKVSISLIKMFY
ncbi:hypothetical protein B0H14DRAFT_2585921 [Mycena olivaceomarginata]|nr:hypothetical protein B0H14DRAFT_2585921 [Mycena olivaceomarginata]